MLYVKAVTDCRSCFPPTVSDQDRRMQYAVNRLNVKHYECRTSSSFIFHRSGVWGYVWDR